MFIVISLHIQDDNMQKKQTRWNVHTILFLLVYFKFYVRRQCVQIYVIQIAYYKTNFQHSDYVMTKCINSIIAVFTSILCKKYLFIYEGMPSFFISIILLHTSITRRSCSSRMNLLFCCISVHTSIYQSIPFTVNR